MMDNVERPPLSPFARAIHWSMALALVLAIVTAGRWLGMHAALGMLAGVVLVVWVVWLALFRRNMPPANPLSRYLLPAMVIAFALVPLLGLVAYGGKYGTGPLGGLLTGWSGLGQAAAYIHGPLALLLIVLALVHTLVVVFTKVRKRLGKR